MIEGPADDVRAGELGPGLGEDSGDVEGDIAVADHRRGGDVQRRVEVGEIGVAVIPADERGRADHSGKAASGQFERPVVRRSGGEDDGVVKPGQLGDGHVRADGDIADEADVRRQRHLLVAPVDRLDRLVVGGDSRADQPVGDRQSVDHVDLDLVAVELLQRLGGVIARRSGTDDRHMPHLARALPLCGRDASAAPGRGKPPSSSPVQERRRMPRA